MYNKYLKWAIRFSFVRYRFCSRCNRCVVPYFSMFELYHSWWFFVWHTFHRGKLHYNVCDGISEKNWADFEGKNMQFSETIFGCFDNESHDSSRSKQMSHRYWQSKKSTTIDCITSDFCCNIRNMFRLRNISDAQIKSIKSVWKYQWNPYWCNAHRLPRHRNCSVECEFPKWHPLDVIQIATFGLERDKMPLNSKLVTISSCRTMCVRTKMSCIVCDENWAFHATYCGRHKWNVYIVW